MAAARTSWVPITRFRKLFVYPCIWVPVVLLGTLSGHGPRLGLQVESGHIDRGQRRPRFSNEPPGLRGHQHGDFLLADKPVGCGPGGLHSDSRPVVTQGPWLPTKGRFT